MMALRATYARRPFRTCKVCGSPAPLDAIRLRGGQFYCPDGECRQVAERIIREARQRLGVGPTAE